MSIPAKHGDPLARHSLSARELQQLLASEQAGKPFLAFRDERGALVVFVLSHGEQASMIGRRAQMDVSIWWDGEVSGVHAELRCLGGEWTIVDDGLSTNGTFVNGQRLGGRERLRDGDRILVGQTVLAYNAAAPAQAKVQARPTVSAGDRAVLQPLSDSQRRVLVALCRPYRDGTSFASPATNQQIAAELCLSVDAVKMHLRTLFAKFELADLPQNQKRARLAECALRFGLISQRELA